MGAGFGRRGGAGDPTGDEAGVYRGLLAAVAGFGWLLPVQREDTAVRLHRLPTHAHNRVVHALLKDQTLETTRREFHQSSRAALADGSLTPTDWTGRWGQLGALGPHGLFPGRSRALRRVALGTSGGAAPWHNARTAAVLLSVASLPWQLYTLPSKVWSRPLPGVVFILLWAARWPLYGVVYGYLYPWLRGRSPLGKALCECAVVLAVELAPLLDGEQADAGAFAARALATAGNALAVFLVLGLFWEARLVRSAGLRWGQIRNFRTASALAVPTTTILIAAVTAFAATAAGTWASDFAGHNDRPPGPFFVHQPQSVGAAVTCHHGNCCCAAVSASVTCRP